MHVYLYSKILYNILQFKYIVFVRLKNDRVFKSNATRLPSSLGVFFSGEKNPRPKKLSSFLA